MAAIYFAGGQPLPDYVDVSSEAEALLKQTQQNEVDTYAIENQIRKEAVSHYRIMQMAHVLGYEKPAAS